MKLLRKCGGESEILKLKKVRKLKGVEFPRTHLNCKGCSVFATIRGKQNDGCLRIWG